MLSQAGRGGSGGISCAGFDDTTKFGEEPVLLGKLGFHRSQFVSELGFARAHPFQ